MGDSTKLKYICLNRTEHMLCIYIDKLGQDINGNRNNTGTAQERHGTEMAELLPINKVSEIFIGLSTTQ